jgi:O-antigen/teichoic acid export membrane protein
MINQVLIASNRQVVWTKVMVAGAIVNPLINLFLIRYFQEHQHNGAIGAAMSLSLTEYGMALVGLILLAEMLDAGSVLRLTRAGLATAGMALVVWSLNEFGLAAEIAAGSVTFAVLALVLRVLNREELTMLRGIAGRAMTRGTARASTSRYRGWEDVSGKKFSG